MNITFYHYSEEDHDGVHRDLVCRTKMGRIAVWYARRAMPQAHIIQLIGPGVIPHIGADERIQQTEFNRPLHQSLVDGPTLHLDLDMILLKDVSEIFDGDFDMGLCVRQDWPFDKHEPGAYITPVFSKSGEIWKDFANFCGPNNFSDVQLGYYIEHDRSKRFKKLPGKLYGYVPHKENEDYLNRSIIHFKGHKKFWMR